MRRFRRELLKGQLTQRDVINKVKDGDGIVYATYCGMLAHFGRKSVDYESIELHPPTKLKLEIDDTKNFMSPISFSFDGDDQEESNEVMFFNRSFTSVMDMDNNRELTDYEKLFDVMLFFDNKKDADVYFLKTFRDFYNKNGFGRAIKYFRSAYKDLVDTDPDLVLKIIGK
jgi:hypothetical protein